VPVTVQHQFGAFATQDTAQPAAVSQPLAPFLILHARRVMQQHQPEQPLFARLVQQLRETLALLSPKASGRHERRRGQRTAQADKGDAIAHPQGRKHGGPLARWPLVLRIGLHVWLPLRAGLLPGGTHIGIVVTGHHGNPVMLTQAVEPLTGLVEFIRQADLGQVTGNDNVLRLRLLQVLKQRLQHFATVFGTPFLPPRQVTQQSLVQQLPPVRSVRAGQVRISQVGKRKPCRVGNLLIHAHCFRMPVDINILTSQLLTSNPAVPRKIGLLTNPNSHRNRGQAGHIQAIVANHLAIDHRITTSAAAIGPALRAFAEQDITVLAINGGDGTTARVFAELLEQAPFQRLPAIILLPGGTTNMNAGDVGIRGKLVKALKRLADWSDSPARGAETLSRAVLRAAGAIDGKPAYGMFFGAGTIISGIDYCKAHIHTLGIRDELGPGVVMLRTMWGIARKEPYFSAPTPTRIELDGRTDTRDRPVIQLIVSSLERLFLGLHPFWGQEAGPLHCTWIEKPTRKVLRAFPSVVRGKPNRHVTPDNGYFSHNAEHIRMWMDGLFTLDGEIHEASRQHGPVTITTGGTLDFLRIDD
jgi:diacylglycerol kinase (ATP)